MNPGRPRGLAIPASNICTRALPTTKRYLGTENLATAVSDALGLDMERQWMERSLLGDPRLVIMEWPAPMRWPWV